ncbi:glutathione S-transferase [Capronia epimyces CBS 606.96]|uniref:Glutathione S-transferase n=1 Tax=Capronia epimyces CBS 606.96 TaxID=1182542 RepID=W9XUT2_9EURO|nr:glutathione S-transferase [Capronia epimyces CBS 606.96]EXJ80761.1 glutathione S-transferase [Capronia epimyces CBS 606.96]
MLTIHHLQRSQSERIPWLCEELGIPYELKLYKRSPLLSPPELQALTPLGAAPVVEDASVQQSDGKPLKLAESSAIVEYIIHKHGNGRLALPPSHKNYPDYLYWFHLANGNLQPCVQRSMHFAMLKLPPDHPARKNIDARLTKIIELINDRLNQVPWLAGDEFTAADIMSVFSLTTMRLFFPFELTGYNGILSWLQRVGQRPAYRVAMGKGDPDLTPVLGAEAPELFPGLS